MTAIYIVGLPANITTMLLLPVPVPGSLLPRGCRDRGKTAIYNLLIKLRNKLITIHNIFILVFCLPLLFGLPPKMMDPQSHALPPGHGHTLQYILLCSPQPQLKVGCCVPSLFASNLRHHRDLYLFIFCLTNRRPKQYMMTPHPPIPPQPHLLCMP